MKAMMSPLNVTTLAQCCAVAACALSMACSPPINSPGMALTEEGAPCGPEALIEDGEDNNNQVKIQDGRSGYMYTYLDTEGSTISPLAGTQGGVFEPTAGGANGSKYAMRMHGTVGTAKVVFVGMGMNFTDPKDGYDMSKYKGISFYAKRGQGSAPKVRVKIPDGNTDPDGGLCSACYNDFGKDIKLSTEWQQFIIPFGKLRQEQGWGAPRPGSVAQDKAFAVQFAINEPGVNYDIWVDDVAFTGCAK